MKTKTKTLAQTNGIIGIAGGALLLILTIAFWVVAAGASSSSSTTDSYEAGFYLGQQYAGFILGSLFADFVIIVALFVLGIVALNYYKVFEMSKAPHILLIVGSCVAIIPLIGKIIGAILLIIGGVLYLVNLTKFDSHSTEK